MWKPTMAAIGTTLLLGELRRNLDGDEEFAPEMTVRKIYQKLPNGARSKRQGHRGPAIRTQLTEKKHRHLLLKMPS